MADELRFRVTADGTDQAAKDVGKVQDAVDQLEGTTATVSTEADDQATPTLDEVQGATDDLDGTAATVDAEADDNASGTLDDVQSATDDLDGQSATVDAEADDNATSTLEDVQGATDDLDGQSATVTAEVDDQASGPLGDIQGALDQLPGPLGEVSGLIGGLGGGMVGAAAGIGGLAAAVGSSISKFQDLGIAVDEFSTKTGASFEDASRFIEVADDLGMSVSDVETAIGRMNREAENSPKKFDDIGASVVRNADGTLNAKETYLGVVDALSKIQDAGIQADAGFAIFGKGWANLAPMIGAGADDLRERLEGVDPSKIWDADKVAKSQGLRDAFDTISDAVDKLQNDLADKLAPAIIDASTEVGGMVGDLEPLIESIGTSLVGALEIATPLVKLFGDSLAAWQGVTLNLPTGEFPIFAGAITQVTTAWDILRNQIGDTATLNGEVADSFGKTTAATVSQAEATAAATREAELQKTVTEALDKVMDGYTSALKDSIKALEDEAAALDKQAEAFGSAADDQLGWNKALDDFNTKAKDGKSSTDDIRDAAIKASKEFVGFSGSLIEASGSVQTATQKVDAQNASLLQSAATAKGPAKAAIIEYIGAVNGIPPEKMTEIQAAINAGDLVEAQRLLDEASAPRQAAIKADADRGSIAAANQALDAVANQKRTATIDVHANVSSIGAAITRAAQQAGGQVVGTSADTAAVPGATATLTRPAGTVNYVTVTNNIQVPRIPSGRELERITARWARINGKG